MARSFDVVGDLALTRTYQPSQRPDGTPNPKHRKRKTVSGSRALTKFARADFIAWDGEGVTRRKHHEYILLMNSMGADTVTDVAGLDTLTCLDVLCSVGEAYPHSIHVAFGASYDVNMMLRDCTYNQVAAIWAGDWVPIGKRFVVNYRARKSFTVRRAGMERTRSGAWRQRTSSIVLWDVFGFFQSSFVDACVKYLGDIPELIEIRERKAQRAVFKASQLAEITHYCALECDLLVRLMTVLHGYLNQAGLPISRWDGAGACAASLLKREGIHDHQRARDETPDDVLQAAQCAYAGGRTELVRYGHAPNTLIYHYDINSAYPSAMRECPSLADGTWIETSRIDETDLFTLVHVDWQFADGAAMYPFFWRSHDTSIYYPSTGSGWYWLPEWLACQNALCSGAISGRAEVSRIIRFERATVLPFDWLDTLFTVRRQWKAAGIGAEKVLKLAINSLYGKTAQHVGGTANHAPRYHQLEWAGFITSLTRAAVYRACTSNPNARIIMVATDGVYSLDPLDLPLSSVLGEWEYHQHTGITVAQSGVYWTDDADDITPFCRGFDKGSLRRRDIVRAWAARERTYDASLTRFVTMGSALASRIAFADRWRQWRTTPRELRLSPDGTKRFTVDRWTTRLNPARGLMLTRAAIPSAQIAGQIESFPYALPWDTARDTGLIDGASAQEVEREAFDSTL